MNTTLTINSKKQTKKHNYKEGKKITVMNGAKHDQFLKWKLILRIADPKWKEKRKLPELPMYIKPCCLKKIHCSWWSAEDIQSDVAVWTSNSMCGETERGVTETC